MKKLNKDTLQDNNSSEERTIALFDFDGTISYCDSLLPFFRFIVGRQKFYRIFLNLIPKLLMLKVGLISAEELKSIFIKRFCGQLSKEELTSIAEEFAEKVLPKLINPIALIEVKRLQKNGVLITIISASPELYLKPWAATAGIKTVISTKITSTHVLGKNCKGQEKVNRLFSIISKESFSTLISLGYGDSSGDREMLSIVNISYWKPFRKNGFQIKAFWKLFINLI